MTVPTMIETKVTNSLKGSVLNLIQSDYQFIAVDKIQQMFASDVVDLVNECYKDPWKLDVGQILWYGVEVSEKPNYGKNSKNTPLTPIVLTLISKKDLEMKKGLKVKKNLMKKYPKHLSTISLMRSREFLDGRTGLTAFKVVEHGCL